MNRYIYKPLTTDLRRDEVHEPVEEPHEAVGRGQSGGSVVLGEERRDEHEPRADAVAVDTQRHGQGSERSHLRYQQGGDARGQGAVGGEGGGTCQKLGGGVRVGSVGNFGAESGGRGYFEQFWYYYCSLCCFVLLFFIM